MRYRIVIEVDTDQPRKQVNILSERISDLAVTTWSNPVYLSTEEVCEKNRTILKEVK